MKKYYAVRSGRQKGIFEDWASCEKQVKGYRGAEYKSFKSLSEAQAYLKTKKTLAAKSNESEVLHFPCAYIDGSYDAHSHQFSYGAVIMEDSTNEKYFSQKFDNRELADIRNVAGEIKASEFAIAYAVEQGWSQIFIYYDYFGIEKWALGEWKRNIAATQSYYEFCQSALKKIEIKFIKVRGHSGNKYNDLADSLARQALGL